MEYKGVIKAKAGNGKAAKIGEDWYNFNTNAIKELESYNKGDEVVVTFETKGTFRNVSKIVKSGKVESESQEEFVCEDCGEKLKDGKYKKCYTCNQKAPKEEKKKWVPKSENNKPSYDNNDRTAQIQRGNALNASAMVASGMKFDDPQTAGQFVKILADDLLEWLRAE